MKKEHIKLSDTDEEALRAMLARGTLKARSFKRATGLLELARGKTLHEVRRYPRCQ